MFKNKIQFNFFSKLFLFFALLTILIIGESIFTNELFIAVFKKQAEEKYTETLIAVKNDIDTKLKISLGKIEEFTYCYKDNPYRKLKKSSNPLRDFPSGMGSGIPFFDKYLVYDQMDKNIFYYNANAGTVTGDYFTKPENDFFNYHYPKLDVGEFKLHPGNFIPFYMHLPRAVNFRIDKNNFVKVILYIYPDLEVKGNYFLVNIDELKIRINMLNFLKDDGSEIMMIDADRNVFSRAGKNPQNISLTQDFLKNEKKFSHLFSNKTSFTYRVNGDDRFYIRLESNKSSFRKFYYLISIPYKTLYRQSAIYRNISLAINLLTLALALFISFVMSRKLYHPLKSVISLFNSGDNSPEKDEFGFIKKNVRKLFNDREKLSERLTSAMPIISENYLYNLLNEDARNIDSDVMKVLRQKNIDFKYPNFAAAICRIDFKKEFHEKSGRENKLQVLNRIYKTLKKVFPENFVIFILSVIENEFCIIINLPGIIAADEIVKSLNKIHELNDFKQSHLEITTGIGHIHFGFQGLKDSYHEACSAVNSIQKFDKKRMKIFTRDESGFNRYYSIEDENRLMNFLYYGYGEKAAALLKKISRKYRLEKTTAEVIKKLYFQFHTTVLTALDRRNISEKEVMQENYFDVAASENKMEPEKILDYVYALIDKMSGLNKLNNRKKINTKEIISYIDKNYSNDISLKNIASQSGTSMHYLSRVLKETLNMTFQEYLNNLRLSHAKHLLNCTDKSIEEISTDCGYKNRHALIRMFKILEGITPTEYRTMQNGKN